MRSWLLLKTICGMHNERDSYLGFTATIKRTMDCKLSGLNQNDKQIEILSFEDVQDGSRKKPVAFVIYDSAF